MKYKIIFTLLIVLILYNTPLIAIISLCIILMIVKYTFKMNNKKKVAQAVIRMTSEERQKEINHLFGFTVNEIESCKFSFIKKNLSYTDLKLVEGSSFKNTLFFIRTSKTFTNYRLHNNRLLTMWYIILVELASVDILKKENRDISSITYNRRDKISNLSDIIIKNQLDANNEFLNLFKEL